LLDQITDETERELQEREGPQAWLDWQERQGGEPLGYFLDGFEGVSEDVFYEALLAYAGEHAGHRPAWWWSSSLSRNPIPITVQRAPLVDLFPWLFPKAPERPLYAEPRLRLGGTGVPDWERFAYVPQFQYGIPANIVEIDPADPPRYESQAAYLRRHGLLLPGEAPRLRPRDFKPEPEFGE